MFKFEFDKKNRKYDLKVEDIPGFEILNAIESFGKSIQLLIRKNVLPDAEEEFKRDAFDCFKNGLYSQGSYSHAKRCFENTLIEREFQRTLEEVYSRRSL